MTELLLVRHGQTDWNREGRFQGQADPPLNEAGRAEARAVARKLRAEPVNAIYTSDLRRALETARIIGDAHGLTPIPLSSLREADMDGLTGLTPEQIAERLPDALCRASEYGFTFAAGEGYEAVATRVLQTLHSVGRRHPKGTVVVVTHGGPIRAAVAHAAGLSLTEHRQKQPTYANASVTRLRWSSGGFAQIA